MSEAGAALIWSPFDSQADAEQVARTLVEEGLVACANIVPHLTSIFRYNGQVQQASEVGALFKTDARLLERATTRLAELHPYQTPAICGWKADSAPHETRTWLAELVDRDNA
ncbi:divalent-cation tolerance protein CutA [Aurantiacibacter gilvus]|uniref:Divalent-cation tolerance protein CutA n=1 Tax=Aurantiacibacter gilvus TaxID=3139141 RepID=A0ABU9IJG6_9SPHN